jgi:L-cystine uptake protein TcyP (sodium:dicarboxylate symporter family)
MAKMQLRNVDLVFPFPLLVRAVFYIHVCGTSRVCSVNVVMVVKVCCGELFYLNLSLIYNDENPYTETGVQHICKVYNIYVKYFLMVLRKLLMVANVGRNM